MSSPEEKHGELVRSAWSPAWLYLAVGLGALLLIVVVMDVWRVGLGMPIGYTWDGLHTAMQVEGLIRHGTQFTIPELGAPGVSVQFDFPTFTWVQQRTLQALGWLTGDCWRAIGLYFLLTFPLAALASLYLLRRFGVSALPATVCSLLFAFLYFHFFRGAQHLYIGSYMFVPLVVLVVMQLFEPGSIFFPTPGDAPGRRRARSIEAVLFCFLCVSTYVYHSFFACYFLAVAGIAASTWQRSWRPLLAAGCLILLFAVAAWLGLSSTRDFVAQNGPNDQVAARHFSEADTLSLGLQHLLLPAPHHRVDAMAELRARYDATHDLNESQAACLGLVASFGFLALLFVVLTYRRPRDPTTGDRQELLFRLGILNVAAFLIGVAGGIGSLFAFFVTPIIRSYNRVSIFIGIFSLFAVAVMLDILIARCSRVGRMRIAVLAGTALLLPAGLYDQVPPRFATMPVVTRPDFLQDRAFVREIESSLPEGAMVFQLPYHGFPEGGQKHAMPDYEHLKAYFHSKKLRWSFGAVRGRSTATWQQLVASRPVEDMVAALILAGFEGLWINRTGFEDSGTVLIGELKNLLGHDGKIDHSEKIHFFSLVDAAPRVQARVGKERWAWIGQHLFPVVPVFGRGFYPLETDGTRSWRWAGSHAELRLENLGRQPQTVAIQGHVTSLATEGASLTVWYQRKPQTLEIGPDRQTFSTTLEVPAGVQFVEFACDKRGRTADGREAAFCLHGLEIKVIPR